MAYQGFFVAFLWYCQQVYEGHPIDYYHCSICAHYDSLLIKFVFYSIPPFSLLFVYKPANKMISEQPDVNPTPTPMEDHMISPETNYVTQIDVVVIGGGWSGLTACKYMLEEGLSVILMEKRNDFGGIWLYDDDPEIPTVMKSTQCTSSSTVTEMSDYPMPESIGMFPHHTDVLEYLRSYAREYKLLPHILLNTMVERVERKSGEEEGWLSICSNKNVYKSKFLVVATGIVQKPNRELVHSTLKGFTGPIYHASQIKSPLEDFRGKNLLVVGGGETGSDICTDWYEHARSIHWSIPRGQHFFRKYAKVVPWGKPQALDKASSRMMKMIAPYTQSKPGLAWICKWSTNGSLLAYQGHGIPEWRNDAQFFKFFVNKNGKILDIVDYKKLVPKAGILQCNGRRVTFQDGTEKEFDIIIMSTGYNIGYPFLPVRYADIGIRQRYKMLFDIDDPTLVFIGLVRPIVGSLVAISELQARWVAKVFSEKIPLPSIEERRREVDQDKAFWNDYFKNSSQRLQELVEGFTYTDDVAHHAGVYPDYWSLFKKSPHQWMVAYFSPYNTATYRLNEKDKLEKSIQTMQRHKKNSLGLLQYLLIMFFRFIWFDWWLDKIGEIKYRIQITPWWSVVGHWKPVRAMNLIWTFPKRFLFDKSLEDRAAMSPQARHFLETSTPNVSTSKCSNGSVKTNHSITHRQVLTYRKTD